MTAWVRTARGGLVRRAWIDDEGHETAVSYAARWRGADGRLHTETACDEQDALRIRAKVLAEREVDRDG